MKTLILLSALTMTTLSVAVASNDLMMHEKLCKHAAETSWFDDIQSCLDSSTFRHEYGKNPEISFDHCETGLYVTIAYDTETGAMFEGSTGLDPDMCELK